MYCKCIFELSISQIKDATITNNLCMSVFGEIISHTLIGIIGLVDMNGEGREEVLILVGGEMNVTDIEGTSLELSRGLHVGTHTQHQILPTI